MADDHVDTIAGVPLPHAGDRSAGSLERGLVGTPGEIAGFADAAAAIFIFERVRLVVDRNPLAFPFQGWIGVGHFAMADRDLLATHTIDGKAFL